MDSAIARKTGAQPTLRFADLSNPILQPWVREALRKVNERALTAIVMFTPKERCWPIGVPGFLLYPVTHYFLQTPQKVVIAHRTQRNCTWLSAFASSMAERPWK